MARTTFSVRPALPFALPFNLRSLRFRTALAFLLWTAAIQIVVSVVFLAFREAAIVRDLDHALTRAGDRLQRVLQADRNWPPALESAAFDLQSRAPAPPVQLVLRARAENDDAPLAVWPDSDLPHALDIPARPANPDSAIPNRTARVTLPDGRTVRYRVAAVPIRATSGASYTLDLGASLEFIDQVTIMIVRLMGAGLLVGVFGAATAGWIVAGRVAARLERVTDEVSAISPDRLEPSRELPAGKDEIGRMSGAVNAMLRRLAGAFRGQELFISNVAHELKTPVAAMLAEAQVLKSVPQDQDTYRKFVLSVEDETRRIASLVETFLALARFSDGRDELPDTLVSLNDCAVESVQVCETLARANNIRLQIRLADPGEPAIEPVVRGDPALLRVVADNLIRNAVQFSSPGATVEIDVRSAAAHAELTVTDSGPGIPPQFLDRIFDRHIQAPAPNRSVGHRGTGLGLNIAKTIVDLHRGSVEVHNRQPHGCVFTVRLPLA